MNMEALKNAKLVKGWTAKFLRAAFYCRIHLSCPAAGIQHPWLHGVTPMQASLVKRMVPGDIPWPWRLVTDAVHMSEMYLAQELGN